jgi:flagellar hook-basal body complex protein FliE
MDTLREADRLQQDATQAVEDLQTGRRDDLEGVILATQKAETAFNMIQALRNKVMQAYDEIKQMRV